MYHANVLNDFPFKARYYFTHPLAFFKQIKRNIKNIYQRVRYGYCDYDWYEMSEYLLYLIPSMLKTLAEKSIGTPCIPSYSPEDWKKWLLEIANEFESAQENSLTGPENEYEKEYDALIEYFYLNGDFNKNLTTTFDYDTSREHYEQISKAYNKRLMEIGKEREVIIKRAFMKLSEHFLDLWD